MMAKVDKQKLHREEQLFAYSSALERGDFETVARILQAAEYDPLLADMLAQINSVYEQDLPRLTPLVNHANNHHEEKLHMTASVTVIPHRPLSSSRTRPSVTLLAAMLAVSLLGGIMLFMRPGNASNMQASVASTASPTATITPTLIPTASPVGANDGVVNYQIVTINTGSPDIRLTVHTEPDVNAHIVTTLPDGKMVTLVAYSDDGQWMHIILPDGSTGWVIGEILSPNPNMLIPSIVPAPVIPIVPSTLEICQGIVGSNGTEVYPRPNDISDAVVLSVLPPNTTVVIMERVSINQDNLTWFFINGGADGSWLPGWVRSDTVIVLNNCPLTITDQAGVAHVEEFTAQHNAELLLTAIATADLLANPTDRAAIEKTLQAQLTGVPFVPSLSAAPMQFTPTPTAYYNNMIGDEQFSLVTIRPAGEIPAGTFVRVTSAYYTGTEWIYQIVDANGAFVNAREADLALASQVVTQLAPTPTFVPTPTLTFTPTPANRCNAIYRGTDGLRVYTRPDGNGTAIGSLPTLTSLHVVRQEPNGDGNLWYLVTAILEGESQITGWIPASEVTVSSGCQLP